MTLEPKALILILDAGLLVVRSCLITMELFFSPRGRIKRLTFWEGLTAWFLLHSLLLIIIIMAMMYARNGFVWMLADTDLSIFANFFTALFFAEWVFAIWTLAAICAKRWHDLNFSGWLAALNTVPVVVAGQALLAFFGGLERDLVYRYVTDPKAMGEGQNLFEVITRAKIMFYKDYVEPSPMYVTFAVLVVAGVFLFPCVLKGTSGANVHGKAGA